MTQTNPLPQLIPACQRVAKLCGVEMPGHTVFVPSAYSPIPDDLYALMLVGWVQTTVRPWFARYPQIIIECRAFKDESRWMIFSENRIEIIASGTDPDYTVALVAALTAACEILDGRGEVG